MHVFVTGASGWIGSEIVRDLLEAGHSVTGLVRSRAAADVLSARGATPMIGSIDQVDLLRGAASDADGVIHTAMGSGFSDSDKPIRDDIDAIKAFGKVYQGTDRPIIATHGLGKLSAGEVLTEDSRPPVLPEYPRASEQTIFALASCGIRASVVRPARSIHGVGERHGFVPLLADLARRRGVSAFAGEGGSLWPACHRRDVARVYRLAIERGVGGEAYHAVAEGVAFRRVAAAIGRQLGVPVQSITAEQAHDHFGELAIWVTGSGTVATDLTRARLGWKPREIGLLADIDRPEYLSKGIDDAD